MSAPMFIDPRLPWLEPARVAISPAEMVRWREYDEDSLDPDEQCAPCAGTGRWFITGDTKSGGVKVCSYTVCPECRGSGMA